MKKQTIILMIIFLSTYNIANAQNWQWAKGDGSNDFDYPSPYCNPALDLSGNVYMAGVYYSWPFYCQTDTLSINGHGGFFLAKYDANGNEIWVRGFGLAISTNQGEGAIGGIIYDSTSSAIYVAGGISEDSYFGSYLLSPTSSGEMFIAKYDLNGNCLWAKQSYNSNGGAGPLVTDHKGNIYLLGDNAKTATVGSFSVSPGEYIAKYDTDGNCLWAKNKFGYLVSIGDASVLPVSIKIYNSDLFISGQQQADTVIVDTMTVYTSYNSYGQVLARLDSSGGVKWVKTAGGPSSESYNLGMDTAGNCYFSGTCSTNNAFFDSDTLSGSYYPFMYIAKYDKNGNYQWAKGMTSVTSINHNKSNSLYTDGGGNSYILGTMDTTVNFGSFSITTALSSDMFVARYDNSGICMGAVHFGWADGIGGIVADSSGAFYATGRFYNTATVGSSTIVSHGADDIYIAKHDAIVTGIGEDSRKQNNQLIIYANPNKGTFSIQVPDEVTSLQGAVLIVYDNTGRETSRFSLDNSSDRPHFNVVNAASGMYIIKLVQGNNVYVGKLVVQ